MRRSERPAGRLNWLQDGPGGSGLTSASTPAESRSAGCRARLTAMRRPSTTWSSASRDALRARLPGL
eukprot:2495606-Alexandrium_andersonii.AAC.1